jgi:ABC-type dipeptide/oligopeptide/nickel transport system permease component
MFLTLAGVFFLTFWVMTMVPGNPVLSRLDRGVSESELRKRMSREKLNLSEKLGVYALKFFTFDFGKSLITGEDIRQELKIRVFNTALLAFCGLVLLVIIGLSAGIAGAYFSGTWIDQVLRLITTLFLSTPVFWFGLVLMVVFSLVLGWLPVSGTELPQALVLPALTVGLRPAAFLQRVVQNKLLEILEEPYILVAYAKGLSKWRVVISHGFRNTLVPTVTLIGLEFGNLLTGAVVAETLFAYKGIGTYILQGILSRDYNVILASVLVSCLGVMFVNFIVEGSYRFLDPKYQD